MAVGTWQVSGTLWGKQLLFPVVVFPEFPGSFRLHPGRRPQVDVQLLQRIKEVVGKRPCGGCVLWQTLCNSVPVFA